MATLAFAAQAALAQQTTANSGKIDMDAASKRAFVEKVLTVRAGDPKEKVIEKLGKPWLDNSTAIGGKTLSRSIKYYVKKPTAGHSQLDEYVDIYLDKRNRVDGVYLSVELK